MLSFPRLISQKLYKIRPQLMKLFRPRPIRNHTRAFKWFVHCRWPWRYFKIFKLFHIKFLKNGVWYGKSYYRLLIGNHTLAFDRCHFWWHWSIFEGHVSLGCHFHVHFRNRWHAFASRGIGIIWITGNYMSVKLTKPASESIHWRMLKNGTRMHRHRRRREGGRARHVPPPTPKNREKFFGQLLGKIRLFSVKNHVKFGNLVNFSGKCHKKLGYFDNFSGKNRVKFGHFVNFYQRVGIASYASAGI